MPFENIPLPESLKSRLQEEIKEGMTVRLMAEPTNERFIVARKGGDLIAKKLVTFLGGSPLSPPLRDAGG